MYLLGPTGLKWLKGIHIATVCCWVGGAISLNLMYLAKIGVTDGGVILGVNRSIHVVDIAVILIPGALGCLLTGLVYSMFTTCGFFSHIWVTLKWIVTVAAILFGAFFLGPWEVRMLDISSEQGIAALSDPEYLHCQQMGLIFGWVQVVVLTALVFISVFKPCEKKDQGSSWSGRWLMAGGRR
ncbi:MAG: DUF2269 family protein [Candidatus Brocadiia bacterium]